MAKIGDNSLNETKQKVKHAVDEVNALKTDRASINADIQAVRENMQALGIKKEAFDMAMRYASWDEEKREGFDIAYDIVRDAIGLPVDAQGDLFEEKKEEAAA